MKTHPSDSAAKSEMLAIQCALHVTGPAPLIAEGLKPSHFAGNERGQIWSAICHDAAKRSNGRADVEAIMDIIRSEPEEQFRALANELSVNVSADPAHAADYAREVIADHARREGMAAATTVHDDLYAGRDPEQSLRRLLKLAPIAAGTANRKLDWNTAFQKGVQANPAFVAQDVAPRPALLGSFLREGDLGYIYAPRGVGKTWIAMLMANAIARGAALGEWDAGDAGPRRVCYVDGEVNLPDSIERASLVGMSSNIHWLHHETITELTGRGLNLADSAQQCALLEMLLKTNLKVLFLDNLSCLVRGVAENEADDWEMVLDWLLALRRAGITVVVIHHAGRNGQMRGTSRREDAAHWVLKLDDAGDSDSEGAVFKSRFTKNRNARNGNATCPPLVWTLRTVGESLTVDCERHSDVDALVELVLGGMTSAREIAAELDVTAGTVSKWARKAAANGRIKIEGRQYKPGG